MTADSKTQRAGEVRGKVANLYSKSAESYKDLWAPELLPLSRELLPHLPLANAQTVLDAGAGVGTLLSELKERARGAVVVAADLSVGMLKLAPREYPRAVMDASRLSCKDESFDVAVLAFVLFHVLDPQQAMFEMARVLRPEGAIGTITWGDESDPPAYDIWFEELAEHDAPPGDPDFARFDSVDTPEKVGVLMKKSGLQPERAWVGEYRTTTTVEEFLAHRTSHGQGRARYEAMPEAARSHCLERARSRLERLEPDGFAETAEVVFVVARKPAIVP